MSERFQECIEGLRLQANDMVVDIPVKMVQTALQTVEVLQLQFIDMVGEIFAVVQRFQAGP